MSPEHRSPCFLVPLLAVGMMLTACQTGSGAPSGHRALASETPDPTVADIAVWVTTADHRLALQSSPVAVAGQATEAATAIQLDTGKRHQQMLGFGASITDSSAWLIQHRMQPAQREALLRELFGRADGGVGFDFTRLTIGASDFSRHHYSLDDMPPGRIDPRLARFSIAPNLEDVVPVTKQALRINPDLKVMASPWSAPAWMKSNDSLIQGTLRPKYYDAFARYLLRYVQAYEQEGIPIFALTLQNEPSFEPKDYPGMRLSANARAAIIGKHLGPLLQKEAPQVRIFDWDHNWDKPEEPLAVLKDPVAAPFVSAVAWHCYAGTPDAQTPVRDAFPDKAVYMTECSGGNWEPLISGGLTLQTKRLMVDSVRHWAAGVLFWNLALDQDRGPHAGGCDTCRGVVTIDSRTGEVSRTDDYYALAHVSRFVRRGAWRIESSDASGDVSNVAFLNPDDSSIAMLVVNSGSGERPIQVSEGQTRFAYTMPARSIATFVWRSAPAAH